MSTITPIVTAIKTILDPLADIDESSINSYLPSIKTRKVALIIPPMGMAGTVGAPVGRRTRLVHQIPCEFWVRVTGGDQADMMQRGREICLTAAAELQASLTLNSTVEFLGDGAETPAFSWRVDDNIIELGERAAFIRAILTVTVTEWVTLTA